MIRVVAVYYYHVISTNFDLTVSKMVEVCAVVDEVVEDYNDIQMRSNALILSYSCLTMSFSSDMELV